MNNLTIIKGLPEDSLAYLISIIPVIVYVIKLMIDNWGMTELEKLRMSNFKKFQIALTKYIFIAITFVAVMYLLLIFSSQFDEIEGNLIYGMLAFFFIIFIIIIFTMEKIIKFFAQILSFKYEYHIVDDQGVPIYRIIKLSGNNLLLVEFDGIEEFLDSKINRRYKRIRVKNRFLEKFYGSKNSKYVIWGLIFINFASFIPIFLTADWWQFGFYLVFIMSLLLALILSLNYIENKWFKKNLKEDVNYTTE